MNPTDASIAESAPLLPDAGATAPLSLLLDELGQAGAARGTLSVGDIVDGFELRGIGALMLVFALLVMVPIPGLNTVFALPLAALAAQQALGHNKAWLPRRLLDKKLDGARIAALAARAKPWLVRLETILRPRLTVVNGPVFAKAFGLFGLIIALFASIPVPLTHTVPGLGMVLIAAGIVTGDGLAVIAGAVIGLGYIVALTTAFALFGTAVVDKIHLLMAHLRP